MITHPAALIPVSDEVLAEAQGLGEAVQRYLSAPLTERRAMAESARTQRATERAAAERRPLTLVALLEKLGFTREYAEHLVQPYCYCGDSRDGWERCEHSRDEGVAP